MIKQRTDNSFIDDEVSNAALITYYGEFWNPETVDWENSWKLLGRRTKKSTPEMNVYEQRGIYVLYKNFEAVYVGKAFQQSIGYRLQSHRGSTKKGPRWDSFSWFGFCSQREEGVPKPFKKRLSVTPNQLISTIEAILITSYAPRLNSRQERFKNATKLFQSNSDAKPSIEERLDGIERSLHKLLEK